MIIQEVAQDYQVALIVAPRGTQLYLDMESTIWEGETRRTQHPRMIPPNERKEITDYILLRFSHEIPQIECTASSVADLSFQT
jgi:hypothetical protein